MQKQIELWRDNRQKYDFQPLTLERKLNQSQRARWKTQKPTWPASCLFTTCTDMYILILHIHEGNDKEGVTV